MTRELTDPDSDDLLEWSERVTDFDGDSLSVSLELDAIDDGSGWTQQDTDSSNIGWLSFTTIKDTLPDGTREAVVEVEADSTQLTAGNSYRFEILADDGVNTETRRFKLDVVKVEAPSVKTILTVQSSEVNSDLSDFPVYVDLSNMPQSFWNNVSSDGSDILIKDENKNVVPREIASIDTSSNKGELHFKASTMKSSSNTSFTIEVSGSDFQGNVSDVWKDSYVAVYHLSEDPSGAAPQMIDSTGNGNDGESKGTMDSGDLVDTETFDKGLNFDGNDDEIRLPNLLNGESNVTIQCWFNRKGAPLDEDETALIVADDVNNNEQYGPEIYIEDSDGTLKANYRDSAGISEEKAQSGVTVDDGNWHNGAYTYDGSNLSILVDGNKEASNSINVTFRDHPARIGFGEIGSEQRPFPGEISEVRLLKETLSEDWFSAHYTNVTAPNNFYNVSATNLSGDRVYASFSATTEDIRGADLSTSWNIGTASQNGSFDYSGPNLNQVYGLFAKPDGTKFYYADNNSQEIYEETASTPFDPSTGSDQQFFSVGFIPNDIFIRRDDGSQVWIASDSTTIEQFDLPQNWNFVDGNGNTPSNQTSFNFSSISSTNGIAISDSGEKLYILDDTDENVYQYNLSTAYDLSTKPSSPDETLDVSVQTNSNWAAEMRPNGEKLYTNDYDAEDTIQWNLSTAYDISTASFEKRYSWGTNDDGTSGLVFV